MDKLKGSFESLNAIQLTENMRGLDAQSKALLHSREVLAVILQGTVEEYQGYSRKEIMDFIEMDTLEEKKEVSEGRTNTPVRGGNPEFIALNEKTSQFDVVFRAKNPKLSGKNVLVNLHVDIESQKTYRPGYPIEKRGIYYLSRSLSSQLSLVTGQSDYGQLEKCYSIWICRDDIPKEERYSVSFYEMTNTKNIGNAATEKKNYDLLKLVVIRLGDMRYNGEEGEEGFELLRFLNAVMYPHREDFMDTISEYIDFSDNEELWQEVERQMEGLGQCVFEDGLREGMERGLAQGLERGIEQGLERGIRALILDNLEEQIPEERILAKLQQRFELTEEKARQYYDEIACS